jgi:flagellar assembly protein FliH
VCRAVFPTFREGPAREDLSGRGQVELEAERSRVLERARREGLEAGRREGRDAALAEWTGRLDEATRALGAAAHALAAVRAELVAELERELPGLVLGLARRVLERELARPEAPVALVQALVGRLAGGEEPLAVRLHPSVTETFEAWRAAAGRPDLAGLRVERDATLAPGECVLETRTSVRDARLETQLDEALRALEDDAA